MQSASVLVFSGFPSFLPFISWFSQVFNSQLGGRWKAEVVSNKTVEVSIWELHATVDGCHWPLPHYKIKLKKRNFCEYELMRIGDSGGIWFVFVEETNKNN